MRTLFTTGYAGHDPESFVEKLRQYDIETLVDVRQNPVSRKKGFSKTKLSEFLAQQGIGYVHVRELGVPRELRKRLQAGDCTLDEYFTEFRRYASDQADSLAAVDRLAAEKRCCLLCVESRPEDCHRAIVADLLVARSHGQLQIMHI